MMQYVSNVWTQWGRPDTKSLLDWKNRVYSMGERIMDSIESVSYTHLTLPTICSV